MNNTIPESFLFRPGTVWLAGPISRAGSPVSRFPFLHPQRRRLHSGPTQNEDIRTHFYRHWRVLYSSIETNVQRSSGLGLATVKLLTEKGANVAVLDLQEYPESSSAIKFFNCDVTDDSVVEQCVNGAISWSEKESKPLAGAICSAGVGMAGRVTSLVS